MKEFTGLSVAVDEISKMIKKLNEGELKEKGYQLKIFSSTYSSLKRELVNYKDDDIFLKEHDGNGDIIVGVKKKKEIEPEVISLINNQVLTTFEKYLRNDSVEFEKINSLEERPDLIRATGQEVILSIDLERAKYETMAQMFIAITGRPSEKFRERELASKPLASPFFQDRLLGGRDRFNELLKVDFSAVVEESKSIGIPILTPSPIHIYSREDLKIWWMLCLHMELYNEDVLNDDLLNILGIRDEDMNHLLTQHEVIKLSEHRITKYVFRRLNSSNDADKEVFNTYFKMTFEGSDGNSEFYGKSFLRNYKGLNDNSKQFIFDFIENNRETNKYLSPFNYFYSFFNQYDEISQELKDFLISGLRNCEKLKKGEEISMFSFFMSKYDDDFRAKLPDDINEIFQNYIELRELNSEKSPQVTSGDNNKSAEALLDEFMDMFAEKK